MFMYFLLFVTTFFMAMRIAKMFSMYCGVNCVLSALIASSRFLIHLVCYMACMAATPLVFVFEKATMFCFIDSHATEDPPTKCVLPD